MDSDQRQTDTRTNWWRKTNIYIYICIGRKQKERNLRWIGTTMNRDAFIHLLWREPIGCKIVVWFRSSPPNSKVHLRSLPCVQTFSFYSSSRWYRTIQCSCRCCYYYLFPLSCLLRLVESIAMLSLIDVVEVGPVTSVCRPLRSSLPFGLPFLFSIRIKE